jgi:hypothetical protein
MHTITIWDTDAARAAEIDRNLHTALSGLGMDALVLLNSEPPLLARENLLKRIPVLEIAGKYWSKTPGKAFSVQDCVALLAKLRVDGEKL